MIGRCELFRAVLLVSALGWTLHAGTAAAATHRGSPAQHAAAAAPRPPASPPRHGAMRRGTVHEGAAPGRVALQAHALPHRHGSAPARTAQLPAAHPPGRAGVAGGRADATAAQPVAVRPRAAPPAAARAGGADLLPLVMIDPGHGGRDSGAVGVTGTLEKTVTLATALDLQHALRSSGRFRVELTRRRDAFVSLPDRVARAQADGASLFISIHADSSPNRGAHGASVYVRADTPNGTKVTELPASSANSGAIGHALSAGGGPARSGSALLQYAMVDQLQGDIAMVPDPARRAHLYVLGTTGLPSVLVEMGFLSNPAEERLLRQDRYRRVISQAIRDAIVDYFDDLDHSGASRT